MRVDVSPRTKKLEMACRELGLFRSAIEYAVSCLRIATAAEQTPYRIPYSGKARVPLGFLSVCRFHEELATSRKFLQPADSLRNPFAKHGSVVAARGDGHAGNVGIGLLELRSEPG